MASVGACCTCHPAGGDLLAFDLRVAAEALALGDFPHARHHVAGALGAAPTDARVLAAFEALAARTDLTAPVTEGNYYGDYAVTAFARARAGEWPGAVALLARVAEVMPHLGYEHALAAWVTAAPLDDAASAAVARLLATVGRTTIGLHRLRPGERALLESYVPLARAVVAADAPPAPRMMASGLLRRAGHAEEAATVAAAVPGTHGRIQEGLARRAAGDGAGALRCFEEAARLDPADGYAVERARSLYVAGQAAAAAALLPASDDPEVAGLARLCAAPPTGDPVDHLDALRRAALAPDLTPPADATANLLRKPELPRDPDVTVTVRGWESPTNRLLVAVRLGHADVTRIAYTLAFDDPAARPVLASTRGGAPLWTDRGGVVVPADPPPDPALRAALVAAAAAPDLDGMWDRAAEVASSMPPGGARALAAAMVHPPPEAGGAAVAAGVYRYQVACACAIAARPPAESLPLLTSIAFGPVDWSGAAAVVALGALATRDAAAAARARLLLIGLVRDLLPFSTEPRFGPLLDALGRLPAVPPSALEELDAWRRATLDEPDEPPPAHDGAGAEVPPGDPPKPGRAAGASTPTLLWLAVGLVALGLYALTR